MRPILSRECLLSVFVRVGNSIICFSKEKIWDKRLHLLLPDWNQIFFKLNFSSEVSYLQLLFALFQAIHCQARAVHSATVLRWARNADAQVPKLVPNVVFGFLKTYFFVVSGCGPLPNVTDGLFTDCTDSLGKPIDTTFIKGNNVTVTYIRTIIRYFLIWGGQTRQLSRQLFLS